MICSVKSREGRKDGMKQGEKKDNAENTFTNILAISPITSIIMLNVNDLNTWLKRQRLSEQITHETLTICDLQEMHIKDTQSLKARGW